jgi:hypothetical protein
MLEALLYHAHCAVEAAAVVTQRTVARTNQPTVCKPPENGKNQTVPTTPEKQLSLLCLKITFFEQ